MRGLRRSAAEGILMREIRFSVGGGYTAYIGQGAVMRLRDAAAKAVSGRRAAVVTDTGVPEAHVSAAVSALRSAGFETGVFAVMQGESNKTLQSVSDIYGFLAGLGVSRADAIVGVGGGLVGDAAGFAAATYLRGAAFISVPTTVIAQVDSAYGGKTGVDLPSGKNLVGCFRQPAAVICDTDFLATLGERDRMSGMGEIIKYGAVAEPDLLRRVSGGLPDDETVAECVDVKRRFVEADEFDVGERRILNFGHTFGHAFEAASGYSLPHGHAVALGCLAMTRAGERLGVTEQGVYGHIEDACIRAGMDTDWEGRIPSSLPFLKADKKSDGRSVAAVMLKRIGEPRIVSVALDELANIV